MTKSRTRSTLILMALIAILGSTSAVAQTDSDTFKVLATVSDACSISTADLDFGDYNPLTGSVAVNPNVITLQCTLLTLYEVGLDKGANGADTSSRQMALVGGSGAPDELLDYTLSCAGAGAGLGCLLNWGDTTGVGGDTFSGVGLGLTNEIIAVAGTIPANQDVKPGDYEDDSVTATVTF